MARSRVRKIDNLRWGLIDENVLALAAGSAAKNIASALTVPETIMRFRGNVAAWLGGSGAPGRAVQVTAGMWIVPEGTGTTVLGDPFNDGNADWFWHLSVPLAYDEMVTDVVDVPGMTSYREVIDSKAMRRVRPDEEIQLVVTNITISSASAIDFALSGRILFGS